MKQINFKDEGLKVDWIGLNCEKLEKSDLISIFSDHQFKISATFPFVHVDADSGVWKTQIYFNYQLYSYPYPFLFPKSYLSY